MNDIYEVHVDGTYKGHTMGIGWLIYAPDQNLYGSGAQKYLEGEYDKPCPHMAKLLALLEGLKRLPPDSSAIIYVNDANVIERLSGELAGQERFLPMVREIRGVMATLKDLDFRPAAKMGLPKREQVHDLAAMAASPWFEGRRSSPTSFSPLTPIPG